MNASASLVAAALMLTACRGERQASAAADTPPSEQTVGGVGTAVVTKQSFPQVVSAIGTVTARPGYFAELSAPAPTRVAHIFVAPGQRVAEGDSLVEFERAPFDAAARSAETGLASFERAYARAVRLVQAGLFSQEDSGQQAADFGHGHVAPITFRRTRQDRDGGSRSRGGGAGGGAGPVRRRGPGVCRGQWGHRARPRRDGRRAQRVAGRDPHRTHGRRDRGHDRRLRHRRRNEDRPGGAVTLFDVLSRQRRFVYLLVGLLSVAGVWAALRLPSAIYPELVFSRITVIAQGSTLGARQVVFSITRPLEEAVSVVPGVTRVRSHSIRGASEISITFAPRTDMTYALQLVRARVNQVSGALPPDVSVEVEQLTPSLFPVLSYNLEGGDPATLYDLARYEIKPLISRVPGVGRVDVHGSDDREIEGIADPSRLVAQGMAYADVANAIRQAVTVQAVGRVAPDYPQYLIVTDQEAHAPEDIGAVVLGNGLRVRDVASVQVGTEDHVRIVAGDGKPAALINITRQIGGNVLSLADSVERIVAALAPTLPAGVHLKPVYDQAALVRDAVRSVRDAMVIGAGLAVVVLLLFLRHGRITAISATAIPLTLAITVFVMRLIGQTLNLMTLCAMAIAF